MPIKGLRIGAFGWHGSHGDMIIGKETIIDPGFYAGTLPTKDIIGNVGLNRYALSAEYDKDEYTFRAEYLHSQGWGTGVIGSNEINYNLGDKADGWYAFGIVPVVKSKLHAKARYQTYRVSKEWSSAKISYEIGLNYYFTKNLEMHLEYARVNDKSLKTEKHSYNLVDVELDFRF